MIALNDVLQMLDKHYGVVITFDTLSKELYSLKQVSGENMAKFSAPVTGGPYTLVRVYVKDPTRAHRGDEVRSLLQGPEA